MSVDRRTWDVLDRVIGLRGVKCGKRAYLLEDIVGSFKIRQHARERGIRRPSGKINTR